MDLDIVDLSRLQFAVTALYHFLFVPLTIGLAVIIAIMETVYVMTGRTIWRDMTKFWGTLFGINFAMGVATRSEEHTSELQSPCNLVCRLLLEKKKKNRTKRRSLVPIR